MEFFDMFDGNIPSIIAIAVVVLGGALINNGYLSKLLKARKTKTSEDNDALERIENKIDELEKRINHVDKNSLVGNIHNDKLHIIDRLRYFDCYLRLGGNSLVEEEAFKTLIQPNPELWYREQQNNTMKIYCGGSYKTRVAEIKRKLQAA